MRNLPGCEPVREAVSAGLDGEATQLRSAEVEHHLRQCLSCRSWQQEVSELTRQSRLRPPAPVPDLSAGVLAAARWSRRRRTRGAWPVERAALLVLGGVQLLLSLAVLLVGSHPAGLHLAHEVGVTDLALAVGVLAAAWQPWRAAGMLPVILVLAGGLALTSALDVVHGRVTLLEESPHVLAVADALLLLMLRRRTPPAAPLGALAPAGQGEAGQDVPRSA